MQRARDRNGGVADIFSGGKTTWRLLVICLGGADALLDDILCFDLNQGYFHQSQLKLLGYWATGYTQETVLCSSQLVELVRITTPRLPRNQTRKEFAPTHKGIEVGLVLPVT